MSRVGKRVCGCHGQVRMELPVNFPDLTGKPYRACPWHPTVVEKESQTMPYAFGEDM
jgi:hypothetical protein